MKKWTDEQRLKIVSEWRESDLTRVEFCKKKGISTTTLANWTRSPTKARKKATARSVEFVEIQQAKPFTDHPPLGFLRIITSSGTTVELPL